MTGQETLQGTFRRVLIVVVLQDESMMIGVTEGLQEICPLIAKTLRKLPEDWKTLLVAVLAEC